MNEQSVKIIDILQQELTKFANESKESLKVVKTVTAAQAWKILQLAIAISIQLIENIAENLSGPDKKKIAMQALSEFYDKVFIVIDIPLIPNILEPIMHKYMKAFLMALVGASIDATVTTFRQIGVFKSKLIVSQSVKPKAKNIRKKK
jgi:hypothetical protein